MRLADFLSLCLAAAANGFPAPKADEPEPTINGCWESNGKHVWEFHPSGWMRIGTAGKGQLLGFTIVGDRVCLGSAPGDVTPNGFNMKIEELTPASLKLEGMLFRRK